MDSAVKTVDADAVPDNGKPRRRPLPGKVEQPTPEQFEEFRKARKSTSDTPKEKARKPKAEKLKPPPPDMPKTGVITEGLMGMYTGIGAMVSPFDPHCGMAIIENAETCAKSIEELAKTNPAVRRAVMALIKTSAWGGVIAAHAPLIIAVMSHHGPMKAGDNDAGPAGLLWTTGTDNPTGNPDTT